MYLEHLTDSDLALLAAAAGEASGDSRWRDRLWYESGYLGRLLADSALYDALFASGEDDPLLRNSPFLVFAVLLARAERDLRTAPFVEEWAGPGRRLPVFDVTPLRNFAAPSPRRIFLAELLASYTRVASGAVWVRAHGGWRRRRFSELDPLRLLELVAAAPPHERPGLYRRLGDLALFLTGVFPDYSGGRLFPSLRRDRLRRALNEGAFDVAEASSPGSVEDLRLLGDIGRRSYQRAWQASERDRAPVLAEMAEEFDQARRMLNFLTDRYLFPLRRQWFPLPDS